MGVEFRLFGGVDARVDGEPVDLGHARQRCVLAALLVEANKVVSIEQLTERVWAQAPPSSARNALQGYLGKLRSALGTGSGAEISRQASGYLLTVDEQAVDLHRFRQLCVAAGAADDHQALACYRQAFDLWRGEAFAGLDSAWLDTVRAALDEERLAAELDYTDVRLRCGHHVELLPTLAVRAQARKLDERLSAQLMLALYRCGRQAEALAHYAATRAHLAEELGADPSPRLREVHQQILRGDPALAVNPLPRNDLPGDVADFTGRTEEIRRLLDAAPDPTGTARTVVISAIDGMAGVGKTTLALRAAHELARHYPSGQLFVDLHGHTEGRAPVEPASALASLLIAVGVPIERIPGSVEDRASRWRAELAKRSVLVVLDNAASAAQVRPLLPGTAGSLTMITSRRRLAELDVSCSVSLDLLPPADAITLFTRIAGRQRVAEEPEEVAEVVRLCGCLPLAVRIAAARLRTRPAWSVRHLAGRLGAERRRLAELSAGDRSVAAAFTLSYRHLPPGLQRLFRLLGLVPGPHWDAHLAAALAGLSVADAEEGLEQLLDVHLLTQPAPGRYQLHDLLGEHAQLLATQEESSACRAEVVDRMLGYYRAAGAAAVLVGFPVPGVTDRFAATADGPAELPAFGSPDEGLDWLRTERPNLFSALRLVPEGPEELPRRLDLLALLAFAQCFGGQCAEGVETTRALLALVPAEDEPQRLTAAALCATMERMVGSPGAAKTVLVEELHRLPDRHSADAAPLHLRLAGEHITAGDTEAAARLLDELDTMELGTTMRFAVAVLRAMADYFVGDLAATQRRIDIAATLMDELAEAEAITWLEPAAWLGGVELKAGRPHEGLARMDRVIAIARGGVGNQVVEDYVLAGLLGVQAVELGRLGRLAEARTLAGEAADTARRIDLPEAMSMALTAQSLVLAWCGDHEVALGIAAEAATITGTRRDWTSILPRGAPGLVSVYAGDLAAGRDAVLAACAEFECAIRDDTMMLVLLEALAQAEANAGQAPTELAERAERLRSPVHSANSAMIDLIRAHSISGVEPARAAELALRAAETLGSAGLRLEEGRARLRAGRCLAGSGDTARATVELAAAVALFEACGARDLHRQARAAHDELDHRT
ncbi:MAG TPA: BTAD domain-containing putative transcriptional regulator [Pseudonocardiaceae bacterium]|nr:BTAD domain-containing putative transcriptional regulator [Pseudonocardiaceae bacterium]